MNWVVIGTAMSGLGVALGAFAAHALSTGPHALEARALEIFRTAVFYLQLHAIAILGFGLWLGQVRALTPTVAATVSIWPGYAFLVGTCVFSGSLFLLVFLDQRAWGAVTPIGGTLLIAGWLGWAWFAYRASTG